MKKIVTSNIVIIYLILSIGVLKSTHFCMGRTMDVQYFSADAKGCFTSEERKMPCCEDTIEVVSVEEEHQGNHFDKSFDAGFIFLPELLPLEYNSWIGLPDEEVLSFYPDPPDLQEEPIFIKIQSLTYYG